MKDSFARQYGALEQWHWWFRGRTKILETILRRHLKPGTTRDILSVGCGPAEGLEWLVSLAGPEGSVTGLDAESAYATPRPETIRFMVARIEDLPQPGRLFDVVLVLDILEHLDDDIAALRHAAGMLKPGGLLMITVPAFPLLWGGQDVVSQHRRRYTKGSLSTLLERAGLGNFQLAYFNTLLFPVIATIRAVRRLAGRSNRSRSDFEGSHPGLLNSILSRVFRSERHLIGRIPMPVGISLMAIYRENRAVPNAN